MLQSKQQTFNPLKISVDMYSKKLKCSYGSQVTIRIADLTLAPCHRLFYPELIFAHFLVENNKIIDIRADKPEILIMKEHTKLTTLPHCENCQFVYMCPGFCAGAAYENCKNPLIPPKTVCDLQIAKYTFLILKYYQLGLWDEIEYLNDYDINSPKYKYLKDLINNVLESTKRQGLWQINEKEIKIHE